MTDFSPLDSALYESTPEKIAASLHYLRKTDAVMAALMPLSASTMIVTLNRLQWSKTTLTPKRINQHEALKLCEGLSLDGHSDWRLPTRAELLTLVDDTRHEPAIDTALFPDTKPNWYWTSTVCAWDSSRAWFVDFDDGLCGSGSRDYDGGLVRAVRSVPTRYVRVPVEPTQAMLDAAGMCIIPDGKEWLDQSNREVWASMLAAANKENSND